VFVSTPEHDNAFVKCCNAKVLQRIEIESNSPWDKTLTNILEYFSKYKYLCFLKQFVT
jgi:hypothetical protein